MASTSIQLQRLGESDHFLGRVKSALATVAFQVISEGRDTPTEVIRYNYARSVLGSLDATASAMVGWLVQRTNIVSEDTTYNFDIPAVITSATDAEIESQIMSDWNVLAGV